MSKAYLNQIETSVPPFDVHQRFAIRAPGFLKQERERTVFKRMIDRCAIEHRYSFFSEPMNDNLLDGDDFYRKDDFPPSAERMIFYKKNAFTLAKEAIDKLNIESLKNEVSHVIVTSCTGFYAPGLDLEIVAHYGLKPTTERSMIGFMGCYAAFNALKLARHIVKSDSTAKVLILNLELCTIHFQITEQIGQLLSYLIFADGCAASLVSAEKKGLELVTFYTTVIPESSEQITWDIGNQGFDMFLSGKIPGTIATSLPKLTKEFLDGRSLGDIDYWAIHPGGRTVLDAVQSGLCLSNDHMVHSRKILRDFGNMSSATIMFVFKDIMQSQTRPGFGSAMAFGPGVTVESAIFSKF